jgi:hypothetical protein
VLHLLIFIILTVLLISFPVFYVPKKSSSFLRNFQLPKDGKILKPQNVVPGLIYLMKLFEYRIQNSVGVSFLWTPGFISWILGCCFWVLQENFVSLTFISASVILGILAIFATFGQKLNGFSDARTADLGFSVYFLIISISVIVMICFYSLAVGIVTNIILLLILYDWRVYKRKREKVATGFLERD